MAKQFINGYNVPVHHFKTAEERSKFLEEWIEDNYVENGMREDKGQYMGHDAIFMIIGSDTKLVATI